VLEDGKGRITLGRVQYKNTLPLFYKFNLPFVQIVEGTPSRLAQLLDAGLIKGGILSSFYYIQNQHLYYLVPDISISSFGKSGSVLLFSKKPLKEIERVKPSGESLTSNFLTYSLFRKFLGKRITLVRDSADAFLLIGDKALQPSLREKYPYVYDIGELWYKHTGLPAVFALFIVPKVWANSHPQQFAELSLSLINSRERFFKDLTHLPLEEDIKDYLKGLDYRFREEHLKSLELMEKLFREYVMGKL
jgi:chorismate dehydratase